MIFSLEKQPVCQLWRDDPQLPANTPSWWLRHHVWPLYKLNLARGIPYYFRSYRSLHVQVCRVHISQSIPYSIIFVTRDIYCFDLNLIFFFLTLSKKNHLIIKDISFEVVKANVFCKTSSFVTTCKFYFGFCYHGLYVLKFICHFKSSSKNHPVKYNIA